MSPLPNPDAGPPRADKFARAVVFVCGVLLFIGFSILASGSCQAQTVPVTDCCSQALDYKNQYERTKAVLEATREQQKIVIKQIEDRAATDLRTANARILALGGQIDKLNKVIAQKDADFGIESQEKVRQTRRADAAEQATRNVQAELDKERPHTAFGKFWKGTGVVFKYIGIGTAAVGGTVIALSRR